ncbi:MAG: DedA family protein [Thalassovita sp.]
MSDTLLSLLPLYGAPFLAVVTLLSCLALPVPASLVMMAAGGFVVAGDLSFSTTVLYAFVGASLGDQIGFWLGHRGSAVISRIEARPTRQAKALSRATDITRAHGIWAVFLSRWLLSPLGPYVNFAAGAARLNWRHFTFGSATGEAIWISSYVAIGAGAGQTLSTLWPMISDVLGILAALAVASLLLLRARHLMRLHAQERKARS